MVFEDDVTLVVGVDEKYFKQLKTTFKLWLKFWPKLRSIDWLFFYDGKCPVLKDEIKALIQEFRHYKTTTIQAWRPPDLNQYEDQRDRMLTAWVYVPPMFVKTKYWLKLDVDAYPVRPIAGSFPNRRWFESKPAIVAHSWNYSKQRGTKGDWFKIFDEWGDHTALLACYAPLGLRFPVGSRRLSHKRIASYAAFFETEFTRDVATQCHRSSEEKFTVPIPSQDTFIWACAERMGKQIVRVRMKRHGITNCPNFNKLKANVDELMTI